MILALGSLVLGDIHRYWIVLLLGDIFSLWHPVWYRSDSSRHRPHASEWLFSSAGDLYSDSRYRLSGHPADMLLFIKHNHRHHYRVLRFTWYSVVYISLQINTSLCYTLVLLSALGIGIDSGQYYWILYIGCLAWYCSNPSGTKF